MPDSLATEQGHYKRPLTTQTSSRYEILLYESNIYDKDPHPITGLPTPGLHTLVRPLLTAENLSITLLHNRPGSASFEVPLQSDDAKRIVGFSLKRSIVILVDGVPEWSGYIGNLGLTTGGNVVVNVTGWLQLLYGRELRQDLVFNTIDPAVIATRLLAAANNVVANANTITPVSLIPNSGYELNAVGSADLTWAIPNNITSKIVSNTGGAYKGSKYLRFTYSNSFQPDTQATVANYQALFIRAVPGQQFSLRIALRYSLANKNLLISLTSGKNAAAFSPTTTSIGGVWQVLQTSVLTVPADGTFVQLNVVAYGATSATLDLDDIYLIDVNSTSSGEDLMLGNGYFEGYLPGSQSTIPNSSGFTTLELSDAWTRSGSRSLHVVSLPSATSYINLGPPAYPSGIGVSPNPLGDNALMPIDAGFTYVIHAWLNIISVVGSTPTCGVVLVWYDENKAQIGTNALGTGYTTTGIKEITDTLVAPANGVYMGLYFSVITAASQSIEFYLDCLTVTRGTDPSVRNTPLRLGAVDSPGGPVKRTRTYRMGEKVGNSIEELSNVESGFDWEVKMLPVDRNLAAVISGLASDAHTLLRTVNFKYTQVKAGTTIFGIGKDRPQVVFGLGRDPENIASLVENHDTGRMATRFVARGQNKQAMAQDIPSMLQVGLWEDSANISDPGISANALLGYAGGEVVYRKQPIKTWQPTLKSWDGTPFRPKFWTNFRTGDIAYLSAEEGALVTAERQPIRIFGLVIQVDGGGNEEIGQLQTTAGA